jgi:chemotaxis signal transduction protein
VDSLGDIAEIPVTQIEPVPAMMTNGHSLVENLVKPGKGSPERRILIVLSVDRILRRFAVEYAAA